MSKEGPGLSPSTTGGGGESTVLASQTKEALLQQLPRMTHTLAGSEEGIIHDCLLLSMLLNFSSILQLTQKLAIFKKPTVRHLET